MRARKMGFSIAEVRTRSTGLMCRPAVALSSNVTSSLYGEEHDDGHMAAIQCRIEIVYMRACE